MYVGAQHTSMHVTVGLLHIYLLLLLLLLLFSSFISRRRGTFWMEVAKNSHFNFRHFSYDILFTTCYSYSIHPSGKHKYILVSARKIDTFDRGDFV